MIPRFRLLLRVWGKAPRRVLPSSRPTCQLQRVSCFSSSISSRFVKEETPLEAEEDDKFASHRIDYLEQSIEAARTTDQVLAIVEKHAEIMDRDHIFRCIEKIELRPYEDLLAERLMDNNGFQIALRTVAQHVEQFDGGKLYELLMFLMMLGVPPSAPVFEGICSELRLKLNDRALTLRKLHELTRTLHKLSVPSKQILKHTIPVAIQFRLEEELDVEDVEFCASFVEYILLNATDETTLDFIVEAALRHCHRFSLDRAISILFSARVRHLGAPIYAPKRRIRGSKIGKVLSACVGIIAENMDSLSDGKLRALVWSCKYHGIFTDEFLTAVWKRASNWSSSELLLLLNASLANDFMTLPVANQVVSWFLNHHDEIAQFMTSDARVTCTAAALATAAVHNAAGTDEHERALRAAQFLMALVEERGTFFKDGYPRLANFLKHLGVCGIYPRHYLDEAFKPDFQEQSLLTSPKNITDLRQLEEIVSYKLGDSSRYTIRSDAVLRRNRDIRSILMPSLTKVGDFARLITSFDEQGQKLCGLHIDFIFAVSGDGTLLEIPGGLRGSVCLKELPPDSKVVAIVLDFATHFSSGLATPWCVWKEKCLRDEGFCPVIVPISPNRRSLVDDWDELIQAAVRQGPKVSDKAIQGIYQLESSRVNKRLD